MKKIYYLKTCDTCKRVLKELKVDDTFILQEIKSNPVSGEQIDDLAKKAGSYEALFSRKSRQYAAMGLKDKALGESDYRELLLSHYSFLKRPVICIEDAVFCGSDKKTLEKVHNILNNRKD